MITIKLPYKSTYNIQNLMRQYTILIKSCYKKKLNDISDKDIRLYIKSLNNISDLDSRFIENALIDVKGFQKENKIIFNRTNFIKRTKNKITKDIFKENKYLPIVNYGETSAKGNRKFKIDMDNNKIIFKLKRDIHIDLLLPQLKNNYLKQLIEIQELMENNKISVSFKLDLKNIFISYEEIKKETIIYKDNRILGIDLNPNNIGLSILEFNGLVYNILYKTSIDLYKNNKLNKNKKDYNIIMISKQIINVMKSFNVGNISIEDLTIKSKDNGKGKKYNKLCNNDWNRNLLVNNLTKRCKIEGIKVYMVNPAYTSIIGNLMYDSVDQVNASIEISRRGYLFNKMFIKNSFYPEFKMKDQWNRWKKETGLCFEGWKGFYGYIKILEMKYRVPIEGLVYKRECVKGIYFSIF